MDICRRHVLVTRNGPLDEGEGDHLMDQGETRATIPVVDDMSRTDSQASDVRSNRNLQTRPRHR